MKSDKLGYTMCSTIQIIMEQCTSSNHSSMECLVIRDALDRISRGCREYRSESAKHGVAIRRELNKHIALCSRVFRPWWRRARQ